jgi:RimJ/RimL family protein N-acetyltransferase
MLQGFAMFSVIEKASGRWMGQAGPWQPDGWPGTEVGYSFHPDARGKGYATEACAAAMDWAFDVLGWSEVIHSIAPANIASQAVAQRLGSRNRGPGKLPAPLDAQAIDIWGQTREEWAARAKRPPHDHRLRFRAFGQLPQGPTAAGAGGSRLPLGREAQRRRFHAYG